MGRKKSRPAEAESQDLYRTEPEPAARDESFDPVPAPAPEPEPTPAPAPPVAGREPESVQGYFRRIFRDNPDWLRERSNTKAHDRWREDHPEHSGDLPDNIKEGCQNAKTTVRRELNIRPAKPRRRSKPARAPEAVNGPAPASPAPPRMLTSDLERLEEEIDTVLGLARTLGRDHLQEVIGLLRKARNTIILAQVGGEKH
jgi:hypothetical protein